MKSSAITATLALAAAASLAVSSSDAVTIAKDCTQTERQFVNALLQQDKNPFQSCSARARGDITVLSTSRLCPIAECKVWIEYMAENAPDCVYDDTNFGATYIAKAKDCGSAIGNGTTGNDADSPTPAPAGNSSTPTPSTARVPSAGSRAQSGSKDDDDDNTIEEPVSSIPTVTVPTTPEPTTRAPVTPLPSGAAALSVVASLSAVVLSVAVLAF